MTPSVGRIVHYVEDGSPCHAAIVTAYHPPLEDTTESVDLTVFYPTGMGVVRSVYEGGDGTRRYWHWPERVE